LTDEADQDGWREAVGSECIRNELVVVMEDSKTINERAVSSPSLKGVT